MLPLIRVIAINGVIALFLFGQQNLPSIDEGKVLTVCDILADPLKYNGKFIKIRGLSVGTDEGSEVASDKKCERPFTTHGYVWPERVWIEAPKPWSTVDFKLDLKAVAQVQAELRKANFDPNTDRVWLTFSGLFQTRNYQSSDIGGDGKGGLRANGFGHMNAFPGQILLKTEGELKIERGAAAK